MLSQGSYLGLDRRTLVEQQTFGHRMMARRRLGRTFSLVMALALLGVGFPASGSASTDLGLVGFGSIAVDNMRHHVYVSAPQANRIDEFNFKGQLIRRINRIYGAFGMTINGHYLYVSENTAGRILRIDLKQSTAVAKRVSAGLNGPGWLVMTGHRLWTTVGNYQTARVVSVDPQSGARQALPGTYYLPDLAVSAGDPNTLFVAEDGLSPGALFRYDVSRTPAKRVASNTSTDQENIEDLVVSQQGKRVIPASGAPYLFEELRASTLRPDGLRYPGQAYPSAVSVSASGLLATGLENGYGRPDISVYKLGAPQAIWSVSTDGPDDIENVLPHGLALSANGRRLFAVTASCRVQTTGEEHTFFSAFSLTSPSPRSAPDTCPSK